jgi:translation initiation factor 3 subunit D
MWGDNNQRRSKESSIDVRPDWVVLEQIDFPNLNRLAYDAPEPEDVVTCGNVGAFDKLFDRITTKTEKPLQKTDAVFPNVTTTDDPVIRKLAMEGAANVFATDAILAHLMACTRSSASWDIVVQRVGTKLFFDKRDGSAAFDYETVNETAHEAPADDKDPLNTPQALSEEATNIKHFYTQQILSTSEPPLKLQQPNPFASEGERTATFGYRYRKWQLGEDVNLVVRCEVDAYTKNKDNEDAFLTVKALHEFDPKITGVDWRQKLDSQKGASRH